MPDTSFYDNLSLAEQLTRLSSHHHDPLVRHISLAESQILDKAAKVVSGSERSSSDGARIVLVCSAIAVGVIAGVGALSRRRKQSMGLDDDPAVAAEPRPSEPEYEDPEAGP
jgi:hypothetical protein